MPSTDSSTRYHVIVPDISGSSVLVTSTSEGYALPHWATDDGSFWQETRAVNSELRNRFGLSVATLRACLLDWSAERRDSYYVVDNLSPDWRPPWGSRWIGRADIPLLRWREERDRQLVIEWFDDQPSPRRVGWYRPGWYARARSWILDSLEAAGYEPTGDVEQLRSWERSSVMRIPTTSGFSYFKAVPGQWGHEPTLTALLSTRFPELMPDVIAIDPSSGMMLTGEFHGRPLSETDDLACWRRAYASLGHVQRQLSGSIEDLREVGVPVRDLDSLRIQIPALLRDRRRMRIGMDRGITEREAGRLLAAEPRLIEACSRLASGPIPLSLDHGDFWPGNIYSGPDRVTLFDWSDATITHPFFSLVMARDEIEAALDSVPGAGQMVVAAYLAGWTGYASFTELEAIFEDAMLVAPLHQAAMYRTTYLPAMEFVEELDRMTPHFLRWLAARL